jgi:hypothetical protein
VIDGCYKVSLESSYQFLRFMEACRVWKDIYA